MEAERERMTAEELKQICRLTVELTRLRQNECKHLCIENIAPDIFGKLLDVFTRPDVAVMGNPEHRGFIIPE